MVQTSFAPLRALQHPEDRAFAQSALEACAKGTERVGDYRKNIERLASTPDPRARSSKGASELSTDLFEAVLRGALYSSALGALTAASATMLGGTAISCAMAPVGELMKSASSPHAFLSILRHPLETARRVGVEAPRRAATDGPMMMAVTGLPSAAAIPGAALGAILLGPGMASGLVVLELIVRASSAFRPGGGPVSRAVGAEAPASP